jgi:hypothetical protein
MLPGDFTVSEGHGHPLVVLKDQTQTNNGACEKNIRWRLGDLRPYKDHVQNVRRKRASGIR